MAIFTHRWLEGLAAVLIAGITLVVVLSGIKPSAIGVGPPAGGSSAVLMPTLLYVAVVVTPVLLIVFGGRVRGILRVIGWLWLVLAAAGALFL